LSSHVHSQSKIKVGKPIHLGALTITYRKPQKTIRIVLKKVKAKKMKVKSRLFEFMIKNDLIPAKVRWKKSASGVGRLFNDVFNMLDEDDRKKLTKLTHDWGLSDASAVIETLKVERDLHGCAIALMAMHRIYGIKSYIARESGDEITIHATKCMWKDEKGWTPRVCASISAYEMGLIEGIDKNIQHLYTKRRSMGDEFCELVLKRPTNQN